MMLNFEQSLKRLEEKRKKKESNMKMIDIKRNVFFLLINFFTQVNFCFITFHLFLNHIHHLDLGIILEQFIIIINFIGNCY